MSFDAAGLLPAGLLPLSLMAPSSTTILRYSTHGYTSNPGDSPADTHYPGRMIEAAVIEQALAIGPGGRAQIGYGEIALWNGDRALDALLQAYAIDGRDLVLKRADGTGARIGSWPALASFQNFFRGTAAGWRRDGDRVRIRLRDQVARLDVPLQTAFYAGSGGIEGGADLKGKPKPMAFGSTFNVTPIFLGVIDLGFGALHTYQVHARAIRDVPVVRERGAAMTKVSGAPGIGQFRVDAAQGLFQLGFTPAGAITCDVEGDAVGSYAASSARVTRRLMQDFAGLADADLDLQAFSQLDYDQPGDVGVFIRDSIVSVLQPIEAILAGVGAFLTPTRSGALKVALFQAPGSFVHAELALPDIAGIEPLALPGAIDPPPRRARVAYRRNYSPSDDIAGAVAAADRVALAEPARWAAAYSATAAAAHLLSAELPAVEAPFANEADAAAEAVRLLDLYGERRAFRVLTPRYLGQVELGHVVRLTYPFFGLDAGWTATVIGVREDWLRGAAELTVFG